MTHNDYHAARTTINDICNGMVRLCEIEVDDGGEYVMCYRHACHRSRDGLWVCDEHRNLWL